MGHPVNYVMISDLQHHLHHKPWRGLFLGEVSNSQGGISGTMFAVDERTVYLADYTNVGGDSSEFIGSKMVYYMMVPTDGASAYLLK